VPSNPKSLVLALQVVRRYVVKLRVVYFEGVIKARLNLILMVN